MKRKTCFYRQMICSMRTLCKYQIIETKVPIHPNRGQIFFRRYLTGVREKHNLPASPVVGETVVQVECSAGNISVDVPDFRNIVVCHDPGTLCDVEDGVLQRLMPGPREVILIQHLSSAVIRRIEIDERVPPLPRKLVSNEAEYVPVVDLDAITVFSNRPNPIRKTGTIEPRLQG